MSATELLVKRSFYVVRRPRQAVKSTSSTSPAPTHNGSHYTSKKDTAIQCIRECAHCTMPGGLTALYMRTQTWDNLPFEIWCLICRMLTIPETLEVRLTSTRMNSVITHPAQCRFRENAIRSSKSNYNLHAALLLEPRFLAASQYECLLIMDSLSRMLSHTRLGVARFMYYAYNIYSESYAQYRERRGRYVSKAQWLREVDFEYNKFSEQEEEIREKGKLDQVLAYFRSIDH